MSVTHQSVPQEEIARRAYEFWESRGCPPSDGNEDWDRAVAELTSGRYRRNGSTGSLADWLARLRKKITGRDM